MQSGLQRVRGKWLRLCPMIAIGACATGTGLSSLKKAMPNKKIDSIRP
jgi:hypothetical protein